MRTFQKKRGVGRRGGREGNEREERGGKGRGGDRKHPNNSSFFYNQKSLSVQVRDAAGYPYLQIYFALFCLCFWGSNLQPHAFQASKVSACYTSGSGHF